MVCNHHSEIKGNHVEITVNDCVIENCIETNVLLMNIKRLAITNDFFIEVSRKLSIGIIGQDEPSLLNDGYIAIKSQKKPQHSKGMECNLSVETTSMSMLMKHCEITTKMDDGNKLHLMNIRNIEIASSKIECNRIYINNVNIFCCSETTKIVCVNRFETNNVDDFKMMNHSQLSMEDNQLSMKDNQAIINTNNLFFMAHLSGIHCSFQYVEIKCNNEIQLNGKICIDEQCQFRIDSAQIMTISKTCSFKSESVYLNQESESKQVDVDDNDIKHEAIIAEYLKNSSRDNYYLYLHCNGIMNIDGEFIGDKALYIIDCNEKINILSNSNYNLYVLFVQCRGDIDIAGIYNLTGACYFQTDNNLKIMNAKIESKNKLNVLNSSNVSIESSSLSADTLSLNNVDMLQFKQDAVIQYLSVFRTVNINKFEMNGNSKLCILHDIMADDYKGNECIIHVNNSFSLCNQSTISCEYEYFQIKSNGKVDIDGTISIGECCKCKIISNDLVLSATGQLLSVLSCVELSDTKLLKEITPRFTEDNITLDTDNILKDDHDYYLQLHCNHRLSIFGVIQASKSLVIIDCHDQIDIEPNSNINAIELYIRCLNDITFEGLISNEYGNCMIAANNKLDLKENGEIDLLFLKLCGTPTIKKSTITSINMNLEYVDSKLRALNEKINFFDKEEREPALRVLRLKLDEAKTKFETAIDEVNHTMDKTGLQGEDDIFQFLNSMNKLPDITIQQQELLIVLNAKIESFVTLISREFDYRFDMKEYLEGRELSQYFQDLQKAGFNELKDLICKDNNEFETKVLSCIKERIKGGRKKRLKRICLKPEDTWKKCELEKENILTTSLSSTAPLFSSFFGDIDKAMKKKQKHALKYIETETEKALKLSHEVKVDITKESPYAANESLDIIKRLKKEHEKDIETDILKRKAFNVISGVEQCCCNMVRHQNQMNESVLILVSILQKKPEELRLGTGILHGIWNMAKTAVIGTKDSDKQNLEDDDVDEKKDVDTVKVLKEEQHTEAHTHIGDGKVTTNETKQKADDADEEEQQKESSSVIDTNDDELRKERMKKENEENMELLLGYLKRKKDVEQIDVDKFKEWINDNNYDVDWIKNDIEKEDKSEIKQKYMILFDDIGKFISKLKSKPLWNVVDNGINSVLTSDIVAIKVSMDYFGYFGKFKNSFNFEKSNHKNLKILDSLTKQIDEFSKLQQTFKETIDEMEKLAMKSIAECIEIIPRAEAFKRAQENRVKFAKQYQQAINKLNSKEFELSNQYDKLYEQQCKLLAQRASIQYEMEQPIMVWVYRMVNSTINHQ